MPDAQQPSTRARLGRLARRPVVLLAGFLVVTSAFFLTWPEFDTRLSSRFFDPDVGFAAGQNPVLVSARRFAQGVTRVMIVLSATALLVPLLFSGARFAMGPKAGLLVLSVVTLGSGLIVNVGLKGFWGRARPFDTTEFGGTEPFTRAWAFSDSCSWDCSFVSGEAAASMLLMVFALIVPPAWRLRTAIAAAGFSLLVSLNRIAFGAHFLSDVLIAWGLVLIVIIAVHHMLYVQGGGIDETRLAAGLGRIGDRLKARSGWTRVAAGLRRVG